MRFLQKISIKNFLMGIVGILAVLLTVSSVSGVLETYAQYRETGRVDLANELTDDVLEASGFEAKERGITSIALASNVPADDATRRKIQEVRARGDEAIKKALTLAQTLADMDGKNALLRSAIKNVAQAHAGLEKTRETADGNLASAVKDYSAKDWIKQVTDFIDKGADLRLAAFTSNASKRTLQEALRMNLELKQAVWLVGEFAGRERAMAGSFVSSKKPMDPSALEKLNTLRAVVDINLKTILRLKETNGVDAAVLASLSNMEDVFLGRFGSVRRAVYAAAGTGDYPISGKEWVEKSSEGIDSILNVSNAVGKMVDGAVMEDLSAAKRSMAASVAVLALIIVFCAASLWVINKKVINPMHYLNDTMSGIERNNDLTIQIEVSSSDESGDMAASFNRMIAKFNDIIRDIYSSVEHLASSSEELSASGVQIAEGAKDQSGKAAQVSTATQQMSATIHEMSKNVTMASDAAKEASGVASRGGEIVAGTIESMKGIAVTAKESSGIISSLGSRSKDIGNIINVINDIADQTNLLALNAAIEAARAGEQGRGFAVVADEVRKLAEKTMHATKEIGSMIKAMQEETGKAVDSVENEVRAVEKGVRLAEQAGGALKDIVTKVDLVTSMIYQVTTAAEEQSAATAQISSDIDSVAGVINDTSASAQQIAKASQEIAELAVRLKTAVEIFRISREAAHGSQAIENSARVMPFKRALRAMQA